MLNCSIMMPHTLLSLSGNYLGLYDELVISSASNSNLNFFGDVFE